MLLVFVLAFKVFCSAQASILYGVYLVISSLNQRGPVLTAFCSLYVVVWVNFLFFLMEIKFAKFFPQTEIFWLDHRSMSLTYEVSVYVLCNCTNFKLQSLMHCSHSLQNACLIWNFNFNLHVLLICIVCEHRFSGWM